MKHDLRKLDERIEKYTKSIDKKLERIKVIEGQLRKDPDEIPLPILQAQLDELSEAVNKLQSQADEMKRRDKPVVSLWFKLHQRIFTFAFLSHPPVGPEGVGEAQTDAR